MSNFLEQLTREWYEYQGYFVRQNILVGKRSKGGHKLLLSHFSCKNLDVPELPIEVENPTNSGV